MLSVYLLFFECVCFPNKTNEKKHTIIKGQLVFSSYALAIHDILHYLAGIDIIKMYVLFS